MNLIDIHTHILPQVDDGAGNVKIALSMINESYKKGVNDIILTPHYNEFSGFVNDPSEQYERFKTIVLREFPKVRLYLGNEVRFSSNTVDLLKDGIVNTLAGSEYLLVEFSAITTYKDIRNAVNELIIRGYIPVIAHVERYNELLKCEIDKLIDLRLAGALFQVNASSICSRSFVVKRFVKKIINEDLIDFVATDCHDMAFRKPDLDFAYSRICSRCGLGYAKRIFIDNPKIILN